MDNVKGKPIGLIRNIDDLGRLVIPREFLRTLGCDEKQSFEIFLYENGIYIMKSELK